MRKLIVATLIMITAMTMMYQTPTKAANEESPMYYSYIGDKIATSMIPERGKMYYPVVNETGDSILFYVNMDANSNLFEGDENSVYACKVVILSLSLNDRKKVLTGLTKPVTKEKMVSAVGEEIFSYAETIAQEYALATQPYVVKTNNTTQSLAGWLGY